MKETPNAKSRAEGSQKLTWSRRERQATTPGQRLAMVFAGVAIAIWVGFLVWMAITR